MKKAILFLTALMTLSFFSVVYSGDCGSDQVHFAEVLMKTADSQGRYIKVTLINDRKGVMGSATVCMGDNMGIKFHNVEASRMLGNNKLLFSICTDSSAVKCVDAAQDDFALVKVKDDLYTAYPDCFSQDISKSLDGKSFAACTPDQNQLKMQLE